MAESVGTVTILRASTYRATRWKNGGGETLEIASSPSGAGLDRFDWRISVATVAIDGPFSRFTGVDRTLCILSGAGIVLQIDDEPARQLDTASDPFAFSGDAAAHATLIEGAVTDFNVMTRRGRFRQHVERIRLRSGDARELRADVHVVMCHAGAVSLEAATARDSLGPMDTLLRAPSDLNVYQLVAKSPTTIYFVKILS